MESHSCLAPSRWTVSFNIKRSVTFGRYLPDVENTPSLLYDCECAKCHHISACIDAIQSPKARWKVSRASSTALVVFFNYAGQKLSSVSAFASILTEITSNDARWSGNKTEHCGRSDTSRYVPHRWSFFFCLAISHYVLAVSTATALAD